MRKLVFRRKFASWPNAPTSVPMLIAHTRPPVDLRDIRHWLASVSECFNKVGNRFNPTFVSKGLSDLIELGIFRAEAVDIMSLFLAARMREVPTEELIRLLRVITSDGILKASLNDEIRGILHELHSNRRIIDLREAQDPRTHLNLIAVAARMEQLDHGLVGISCDMLIPQVPYLTGDEVSEALNALTSLKLHHTPFIEAVIQYLPIVWMDDSVLRDVYNSLCALVVEQDKIDYIHDFLKYRLATVE